jgi:mRNA-degrading endonuclease RelE of RelBE toxin-antitoxin system
MMMKYNNTSEFDRDFKRLKKRFRTLSEDLGTVKRSAIELCHIHGLCHNLEEISGVGNSKDLKFYKVKKFASLSIPGKGSKTGLRLIYAFFPQLDEIIFLEIYFKGDKENEDKKRIKEFIKA